MSTVHRPPTRTVFITGANGYIGAAAAKAFVRAGWRAIGLVRRASSARDLELSEVEAVIGSIDDPAGFLPDLYGRLGVKTVDVIVNSIEPFPNYEEVFAHLSTVFLDLARTSNANGVKPLLLWVSGCKDYELTPLHGDPALKPLTEESPIQESLLPVKQRTETSLRTFAEPFASVLDAAVLRPPTVYGYTSSYYGPLMDYAASERASGQEALRAKGHPNSIMHSMHVDDCAEGFVALAEHASRKDIASQVFNLASDGYETAQQMADAMAKEYGFPGGALVGKDVEPGPGFAGGVELGFNLSQWVGSEKIRQLTGWKDKRLPFTENLGVYRRAYEAAQRSGHENIDLIRDRVGKMPSGPGS